MERYANEKNVPIIEKKSIAFIMKYIKENNIKNVLEIGSAIGYSAILMASSTQECIVTTIERDEARYMECLKNVKKCGMEKKINVVYQDALELNLSEDLKYDLIFIDAAKGQYTKFFEKYKSRSLKNRFFYMLYPPRHIAISHLQRHCHNAFFAVNSRLG